MRRTKKVVASLLVFMLLMSTFSFANPLKVSLDEAKKASVLTAFEGVKLEPSTTTRVIVEFTGTPIIEQATAKGLNVADMSTADVTRLVNDIKATQKSELAEIKALSLKENGVVITIHEQFTTILNGASMTIPADADLIEAISQLEYVKNITPANEYDRPTPQMSNSHRLTQSKFVNEQYKLKGEGMVVAIIDTGIDPSHKDFNLDEAAVSKAQLQKVGVEAIIAANKLKGTFRTLKVPYGWNYMDNNDEILDLGQDASMHGMHVAGTVAANGTLQGVAPNAQVLALKVFGNDPAYPSTYADIIIKAIDDGIILGADVMNLSLGSTAAFVDAHDPEQVSVLNAVNNGIVMSISAGNSAFFGNGNGDPFATNPDIGVVGAPAVTPASMMVASVDNSTLLYTHQIKMAGLTSNLFGFGKDKWVNGTYPLVALKGDKLGVNEDNYAGVDVKGKIVLISRGTHTFSDKAKAAAAHGAAGVICYNANPKSLMYQDQGGFDAPFMLTNVDGMVLQTIIDAAGGSIDVTIEMTKEALDPKSGSVSAFSSWGTTPNLDFKPDIAAPGGNIYSTLNDNKYGFMSGTSMAAPHASGGAALVLQRLNNSEDFKTIYKTEKQKAELAKAIMMNTGRPIVDSEYWFAAGEKGVDEGVTYTSPRSQGAGSMDLKSAIETDVVVLVKDTMNASFNAGEVTDGFEFTLTAYNQGTEAAEFGLNYSLQTNIEKGGKNLRKSMLLEGVSITMTVEGTPVEFINVPAGGSVDIKVTADVKNAVMADTGKTFAQAFPNGNFVEGFVFLYTKESGLFGTTETSRAAYDAAAKAYAPVAAFVKAQEPLAKAAKITLDAKKVATAATQKALDDYVLEIKTVMATFAELDKLTAAQKSAQTAFDLLVVKYGELNVVNAKILALDAYAEAAADKQTKDAAVDAKKAEIKSIEDKLTVAKKALADEKALASPDPTKIQVLEIEIRDLELQLVGLNNELTPLVSAQATSNQAFDAAKQAIIALGLVEATAAADLAILEAGVLELNAAKMTLDAANTALATEKAKFTEAELATWTANNANVAKLNAALVAAQADQKIAQDAYDLINTPLQAAIAKATTLEKTLLDAEAAYVAAVKAYRRALPLSVPFIAFKGDWSQAPAIDEMGNPVVKNTKSFYNMTSLLYSDGDVNDDYFMGAVSAFSPNGDESKEEIHPILSFLRNLKDVKFTVENEAGETIKTIGLQGDVRKDYFDGKSGGNYSYYPQLSWNGKVDLRVAPEGKYNYVVSGQLDDSDKTIKSLKFPVILDVTEPAFSKVELGTKVKVTFTDTKAGSQELGSGIRDYALLGLYKTVVDGKEVLDKDGKSVIKSVVLEANNIKGEFDLKAILKDEKKSENLIGFVFAAIDNAGNAGIAAGDAIGVEVDRPIINLVTPEPYSVLSSRTVKFAGDVKDASPFNFFIDGVNVASGTKANQTVAFEYTANYDKDGKYEVPMLAEDYIGNVSKFPRHFYIDATMPTLAYTISVGGKVVEFKDGVANIPAGTTKIDVNVKAEDNFPVLSIKVNESEVRKIEKDYQSTLADLKPISVEATYSVDLKPNMTNQPFVIEIKDAAGNTVKVGKTIYVGTATGGNVVGDQNGSTPGATTGGGQPAGGNPGNNTNGGNTANSGNGNGGIVVTPGNGSNTPVINPNLDATVSALANAKTNEITLIDPTVALGAVKFAKAYINGYTDGTFKAEGTVTRAEFAKMLAVILELDVTAKGSSYSDVKATWYTPYIKAVSDAKILTGYANGTFAPDKAITRAEIAQALANIWTYKQVTVASSKSNLKDIAGNKAADAIAKLNSLGVITGYADLTFKPNATATRAETVKMINTFIGRETQDVLFSKFSDVANHWALKQIESASSEVVLKAAK